MQKYNQIKLFTSVGITIILIVLTNLNLLAILGIGLFVFFATKFFFELGHKIEIKDIMILIATLQWIIGPILAYEFYPDDEFYYMAVDIDTYMNYVFPATLMFVLGLYFPLWNKRTDENIILDKIRDFLKNNKNFDLILITIGIISELIIDMVPSSIRFVLFLLSGARFIGLYFLLLNNRPRKWLITFIILFWLFFSALNDAMFHDLLLWLGFLGVILAFIYKVSIGRKAIAFVALVVLIIVIQTIKYEYRKLVGTKENTELFTKLVKDKFGESKYFASDKNINAMVTRINQGWIIARIMNWTPKFEPYADGETIKKSIINSFLPRILAPNKTSYGGGRTNFYRFTGKQISGSTSMGLSILGEAYANYGIYGGSLFLFILGAFFNFYIFQIFKISNKHPVIMLFLPLLFLQVVKAETDFGVVLNHLTKATIALVLLFLGLRKILGIKI